MPVSPSYRCALRAAYAALILVCVFGIAHAQTPIPELHARVTDLTATLTPDQTASLEGELAALETRSGAQLAVLIVATLAPTAPGAAADDIESYATRVFERWKLGRKGVDDGVLLIVVKNDHAVRIEVGYGLEGAIPDAAAARIIREYIAPKFRADDLFGGIADATQALSKLIAGENLPPALETAAAPDRPDPPFKAHFFAVLSIVQIIGGALIVGFIYSQLLASAFNLFPIHIVPIVVRRVTAAIVAPVAIVGVVIWFASTNGASEPLLPWWAFGLAAAIIGWLGWSLVATGASQQWAWGITWKDVLAALIFGAFELVLGMIFGNAVTSSGGGGFSGGGGRSGGGGASGKW